MNRVDCAWSEDDTALLTAANDEAVLWTEATEGLGAALDWAALSEGDGEVLGEGGWAVLPEGDGEADAIADGEAPVLRGTFCRYRSSPSMSSPAQ